jgi:hypothetical protein
MFSSTYLAKNLDFLAEKEDFSKIPLSSHWYFKLNAHGQGVKLSFPVRVKCTVKKLKKTVFASM